MAAAAVNALLYAEEPALDDTPTRCCSSGTAPRTPRGAGRFRRLRRTGRRGRPPAPASPSRRVHRAVPATAGPRRWTSLWRAGTPAGAPCRSCWSPPATPRATSPPRCSARCAAHPGTAYAYGRPLGPHPVLLDLLAERIDDRPRPARRRDGTTLVLLVGRGSTDPDANAEVCKVARLLREGRGYDGVESAFVSLAAPGVPAGLDRCRGARRAAGRGVPYFLFTGVLPDRVASRPGLGRRAPGLDVRVAGVLGDCDELADLVVERYREALAATSG